MSKPAAQEPSKGSRWTDGHGEARVMGVIEGYVVARRKGAAPFLMSAREFAAAFRPAP